MKCEYFTDSTESEAVIKQWNIFGYCKLKKSNISKGICEHCEKNTNNKEAVRSLW